MEIFYFGMGFLWGREILASIFWGVGGGGRGKLDLRMFAPIASAHRYCARKFTPRHASSVR